MTAHNSTYVHTLDDTAELFEPAEYIDRQGPGYFSILAKPDGKTRQESFELDHLETVVNGLNPNYDTYISQAVFKVPNRRATNMLSVGLLFVDLDTYNVPNLASRSPDEQASMMVNFCAVEGIPTPSVILFSGGGLHGKWFLSEALGRVSLPEWNRIQQALVNAFEPFGSDNNSRDISRVLRLDRTVNTKRNEIARVVHVTGGVGDCPSRYDFDELQQVLKPWMPELVKAPQSVPDRPRSVGSAEQVFRFKSLAWARLYDIQRIWELRGGVPVGYREITLFWELNFLLLAEPGRSQDIWREAQSLAASIDGSPGWYHNSDLSTLYRKAKEMIQGDGTTFNGRRYPSLYTPRNTTLLNVFSITPDEEREMVTIISTDEKVRRRREKRWAEGVRPQPFRERKPWEDMGISRRHYYRIIGTQQNHVTL